MKPVIISLAIGIAIVIVAAGFLSRDIPMEKIVSDDFEDITPITPTDTIQEKITLSTDIVPSTPDCDKSYPDFCIVPYPPDLDCDEIPVSNFRVIGDDAHRFDADNDGIGCEVGSPSSPVVRDDPVPAVKNCDSSYPDVCIEQYPPDLDCGEISYSNFRVEGSDPHGFDGDNDGIGCES